ncbi:hypothetical protein CTAYLR_004862 [Chrysophaeum taylorii]|uniref:VPS9 domain-containing protein n=1 Tax=Chrysophaeum taylorii TaxID=2483200 RepID=A0AAD7UEV7_9STRA|nr:hypothetical protein CTAYLR_004862 [Chrysophaeum taylorii]
MDAVSLARRQELLSRARRQRHEWLEACRGEDGLLEKGKPTRLLRRECELEVIEEMSKEYFPSGGRVLRFLCEQSGDDQREPLVPLAGDDEGVLDAVDRKVELRCKQLAAETKEGETDALIERLKHPDYVDVVRSLQHFVGEYIEQTVKGDVAVEDDVEDDYLVDTVENFLGDDYEEFYAEARRRVEAFASQCAQTLHKSEPWKSSASPEKTTDAVETLLHRRLSVTLFGAGCPDAKAADRACRRDAKLAARLQTLSFVDFEHLNQPEPDAGEWEAAITALRYLDRAKAPSDKVAKLKRATRSIASAVGEGAPGADEILPGFIVAIAKANPKFLDSTLRYLKRFGKTTGEDAYVITNFMSAVDFLLTANAESFDMSQEDFQNRIDENTRRLEDRLQPDQTKDLVIASADLLERERQKPLREVSAREIRALRLARQAESAVILANSSYARGAPPPPPPPPHIDGGNASTFPPPPPPPPPGTSESSSDDAARRFVGADPDHLSPVAVRQLLADYHTLVARLDTHRRHGTPP